VDRLPRGREVTTEVPSYELPGPMHGIQVTLMSAEFGADVME
jgi:hypothetical protein